MEKILLIEDEAQTREVILDCLEAEGFDVLDAENGQIGLQRAEENLPDLVICDVLMPELDGHTVLTTLRQNPITAMIPFIFLTAKATKAELRQGMELGADDYLTKPSTAEELLRAIATQVKKQAALRQWCLRQSDRTSNPQSAASEPIAASSVLPCCPQLAEVFSFIEANYRSVTLSDVARAVGYSPAYLTDLVRRLTGQPVHRWIVRRRMADAETLLLETDQTVSQIAETVGYENVGHFSRQFRQLYGAPPKEWKMLHGE